MSQKGTDGTNGTDGTDLTTTLTTQGDILYRDGSGLQRLGAGTSGQVLQTNGTGANPSWGSVSSDFVKLYDYTNFGGSSVTSFDINGYFNDSLYRHYRVIISDVYTPSSSTSSEPIMRFKVSNSDVTTSNYHWSFDEAHVGGHHQRSNQNDTQISQMQGTWSTYGSTEDTQHFDILFFNPTTTGTNSKMISWNGAWRQTSGTGYLGATQGTAMLRTTSALTGFSFRMNANPAFYYRITIYGMKY